MKAYDLFVPLYYNDGRQVEPQKFQTLQTLLLDQFGGLTFFPQPNQGFWTMAGITYHDAIVIYRVLTSDEQEACRFLSNLKERLKEELQQADILIVERDVVTEYREPQGYQKRVPCVMPRPNVSMQDLTLLPITQALTVETVGSEL